MSLPKFTLTVLTTNHGSPRWLLGCNPKLASLVDDSIGKTWITQAHELRGLTKFADDSSFRQKFRAIKTENKENLSNLIANRFGLQLNPEAMFDVQIKRLHEYKRQHLNLLHILTLYRRLLQNPDLKIPPRVLFLGQKLLLDIIWRR